MFRSLTGTKTLFHPSCYPCLRAITKVSKRSPRTDRHQGRDECHAIFIKRYPFHGRAFVSSKSTVCGHSIAGLFADATLPIFPTVCRARSTRLCDDIPFDDRSVILGVGPTIWVTDGFPPLALIRAWSTCSAQSCLSRSTLRHIAILETGYSCRSQHFGRSGSALREEIAAGMVGALVGNGRFLLSWYRLAHAPHIAAGFHDVNPRG